MRSGVRRLRRRAVRAQIVRDGVTGRLVSVAAGGALARALGGLLDDGAERRRLAAAAREWVVREASIERAARRFISLYELLLDERRPGATVDPR